MKKLARIICLARAVLNIIPGSRPLIKEAICETLEEEKANVRLTKAAYNLRETCHMANQQSLFGWPNIAAVEIMKNVLSNAYNEAAVDMSKIKSDKTYPFMRIPIDRQFNYDDLALIRIAEQLRFNFMFADSTNRPNKVYWNHMWRDRVRRRILTLAQMLLSKPTYPQIWNNSNATNEDWEWHIINLQRKVSQTTSFLWFLKSFFPRSKDLKSIPRPEIDQRPHNAFISLSEPYKVITAIHSILKMDAVIFESILELVTKLNTCSFTVEICKLAQKRLALFLNSLYPEGSYGRHLFLLNNLDRYLETQHTIDFDEARDIKDFVRQMIYDERMPWLNIDKACSIIQGPIAQSNVKTFVKEILKLWISDSHMGLLAQAQKVPERPINFRDVLYHEGKTKVESDKRQEWLAYMAYKGYLIRCQKRDIKRFICLDSSVFPLVYHAGPIYAVPVPEEERPYMGLEIDFGDYRGYYQYAFYLCGPYYNQVIWKRYCACTNMIGQVGQWISDVAENLAALGQK